MATAGAGVYRPRHPERTVLYRILAQHFERFAQVYDERFAPTRGPLPPGAPEAVNRYLDCCIFACGVARVRCEDCGHDFFVAYFYSNVARGKRRAAARRRPAGPDPEQDNLLDAAITTVVPAGTDDDPTAAAPASPGRLGHHHLTASAVDEEDLVPAAQPYGCCGR